MTGFEAAAAPHRSTVYVDDQPYVIHTCSKVEQPVEAPRLVVVSYQPNSMARRILETCLKGVQVFTPEPHELWVVDNNSPPEHTEWLLSWPGINVVLNRTEPVPPAEKSLLNGGEKARQENWASYANAVGLEIGLCVIPEKSHYLMTLHMDTMPCRTGWLSFLRSKLEGAFGAAGVRMDKSRTPNGVLHVLGYLVDYRLFKQLQLHFFPKLPEYDVGDLVTMGLRAAGHDVFACRNTLWEPDLISHIPSSSPLRSLHVDRSFDDDGNVIFLHLGRGVRKTDGSHRKGTSPQEWIRFGEDHLFA